MSSRIKDSDIDNCLWLLGKEIANFNDRLKDSTEYDVEE